MADFNWTGILNGWNDQLLRCDWNETFPADVQQAGWLGFPPATDGQLAAAEERLGIALPPSYREFLKVSNGWRRLTNAIDRVYETEEINWFRQNHSDWIAAYAEPTLGKGWESAPDDEYYSYSNPVDFKLDHFRETLQISAVGDAAVLLLNPQAIRADGEWEAWFFADWVPGARRYRSFQELIERLHHEFFNREWRQPQGIIGGLPTEYTGSPCSPKRKVKKRRRQTTKVLGKPLDEWDVDDLLRLLSEDDRLTRTEAIAGLGKLRDPRAIEPLLALVVEDSDASVAAMHTLKDWEPERLREPLLQVIRERHFMSSSAAAMILAELKELRAVPIISAMVEDTSPASKFQCDYVGQFLAAFGAAGFDALSKLLASDDSTVRGRALRSLIYCKDPRVIDALRQLLSDTDPQVRAEAAVGLKVLNAPQK